MQDVAAAKASIDPLESVRAHWAVGLSNALDGSEDYLLSGEAKKVWHSQRADMARRRQQIIEHVRQEVAAGNLTWEKIRHPLDPGVLEEGQEIVEHSEASLADCAADAESAERERKQDILLDWESVEEGHAIVPVEPHDCPEAVAQADEMAQRLVLLSNVSRAAASAKLPQVQWYCQREQHRIEKNAASVNAEKGKEAAAILHRHLRVTRENDNAKLAGLRDEARKRRANVAKVKRLRAEAQHKKDLKKESEAARLGKLSELPALFDAKNCGQGHAKGGTQEHVRKRKACMQRLRLRSPPLPDWLDALYDDITAWHVEDCGKRLKGAAGVGFLNGVDRVIAGLGHHLLPAEGGAPPMPKSSSSSSKEAAADPKAFEKFVVALRDKMPKAATALVV